MSRSRLETEIKLAVAGAAAARRLLRRGGFAVRRRRVFEANTVFDTAAAGLRAGGTLLRVRQAGRRATITYKGPAAAGKYKSREELESEIADAGALEALLGRLGYRPVFRYEKYRTEFGRAGSRGLVTLDETPIGTFLELEGDPQWIDRTAGRLGFRDAQHITSSYGRLYQEWCRQRGVQPTDMVFDGPRRRRPTR